MPFCNQYLFFQSRNSNSSLPLSEFVIEKGNRYRFRLVGATCLTCAVGVIFQGHRVLAISADGGLRFKPISADTIVLNSGIRTHFFPTEDCL